MYDITGHSLIAAHVDKHIITIVCVIHDGYENREQPSYLRGAEQQHQSRDCNHLEREVAINMTILKGGGKIEVVVGAFHFQLWAPPTWGQHASLDTNKIYPVGDWGFYKS
jgi:hypothetical protein